MEENNNIAKNYDPKDFDERLYAWWEYSVYYTRD
jgi:valyl-tRNA synthetase